LGIGRLPSWCGRSLRRRSPEHLIRRFTVLFDGLTGFTVLIDGLTDRVVVCSMENPELTG
jgi:hypothetical protein